jgi:hypothetical protein|tara:strand:+ start:2227 stop:2823 length:597 start_codon:yes stop_codon:yes gene_type:complete
MYKHVGRIKTNQRKVIVAYRTVPGEPDNCVVVTTENLMAEEHDTLMKLIESDAGQNEDVFANAMARSRLPDGRIMLAGFHVTGKMQKVATDLVEMTPDRSTVIGLTELNKMIAEQKGVAIEDLATIDGGNPTEVSEMATVSDMPVTEDSAPGDVIDDAALAAQYRSQADTMFKEAKRLREQAEELVPTKKKKSVAESA